MGCATDVPIYRLHPRLNWFPPPEGAHESGVLAVGGDLKPKRLLTAYSMGIFPWPMEGQPLSWHSPDPRFVLTPETFHLPKSLGKTLRKGLFEIRYDTAFAEVIDNCATAKRDGQRGTWITGEMREAYCGLHRLGFAHSVESWHQGRLAGGLYGVSLGSAFFGESMFATMPDASKVAFAAVVERLGRWNFTLIDCQVETEHLARFGAEPWPRDRFLSALKEALQAPTRQGPWTSAD